MNAIKISKVQVYGVEESRLAATYPMAVELDLEETNEELMKKLFKAKPGSGHDCASKGIIVQFDLKAPEYFWRQLDRYHFIDYVSSQSKMHKLTKFEIRSMCNDQVDKVVIENLERLIAEEAPIRKIVSNTPAGFMLTARMTTNMLQLKSMLVQRRLHKLDEWQEFCNWIEDLFKSYNMV